jgi:hypothetical protein
MNLAVSIEKYDGSPDFCVVKIHEPNHDDMAFSFNMEYLFEWVADEHKALFLLDVFSKKAMIQWNITDKSLLSWDGVDFVDVIKSMTALWKK